MGNTEVDELTLVLNQAGEAFDKLCQERHEKGATEYGQLTFLGNDVLRMLLEELADTANYCRMHAVKLLILQQRLEAETLTGLADSEGDVEIGWTKGQGTKPTGWGEMV